MLHYLMAVSHPLKSEPERICNKTDLSLDSDKYQLLLRLMGLCSNFPKHVLKRDMVLPKREGTSFPEIKVR